MECKKKKYFYESWFSTFSITSSVTVSGSHWDNAKSAVSQYKATFYTCINWNLLINVESAGGTDETPCSITGANRNKGWGKVLLKKKKILQLQANRINWAFCSPLHFQKIKGWVLSIWNPFPSFLPETTFLRDRW